MLTGVVLGGSVGARQFVAEESYGKATLQVGAGTISNLGALRAGSDPTQLKPSDYYFAAAFGGLGSPITRSFEKTLPQRWVANGVVAASLTSSQYVFSTAYKWENLSFRSFMFNAAGGAIGGMGTPIVSNWLRLKPSADDFIATPIGNIIGGGVIPWGFSL